VSAVANDTAQAQDRKPWGDVKRATSKRLRPMKYKSYLVTGLIAILAVMAYNRWIAPRTGITA
jgi:hypothetical protein